MEAVEATGVKSVQLHPGRGRHFRARVDHVMPALGCQQACSRDSFRKLV